MVAADGIALSRDGKTLYWQPLTGRTLYSIETAALMSADPEEAGKKVAKVGTSNVADGLLMSRDDKLYLTSPEDNSVKVWDGDRSRIVVQDPRLSWPDSLAEAPDGSIYVTASRIPDMPWFKSGAPHVLPTKLFRMVPASRASLPRLLPRPEIHLEGPGRARLAVELPVGLGDVVGIEDGVGAGVVALREIGLDPFGVDGAVDDDMARHGCSAVRARAPSIAPAPAPHACRRRRPRSRGRRARDAVAPVNSMVPRPRGTIALAASRAVRKPAKAVISQTLR